jgi:tRNA 2-(methylsulfanyl)-N6-isopentenyladenosine37 hydroxylase
MLHLATKTPDSWVDRALAHPAVILLDHAHCEKKAAATAINMLFRYPQHASLLVPLSHLAREELLHFEMVLAHIRRRGDAFDRLAPSAYAAELVKMVRPAEPDRLLDFLLCFAMIEARSCERMALLADAWPDAALRELYRDLVLSEERHHSTYLALAADLYPSAAVEARLRTAMEHEARAVALPAPARDGQPRLHSA